MLFGRGTRITITDYYGKGKLRPKVGDIGYLGGMYLFPEQKYVIGDGYFFKYGRDKKNRTRMERKYFIIDLGMTSKLKEMFAIIGVNLRNVFTQEYIDINTPLMYTRTIKKRNIGNCIEGAHYYNGVVGDNKKLSLFVINGSNYKNLKIPVVKIRCETHPKSIMSMSKPELLMWFTSNIYNKLNVFNNYIENININNVPYIQNEYICKLDALQKKLFLCITRDKKLVDLNIQNSIAVDSFIDNLRNYEYIYELLRSSIELMFLTTYAQNNRINRDMFNNNKNVIQNYNELMSVFIKTIMNKKHIGFDNKALMLANIFSFKNRVAMLDISIKFSKINQCNYNSDVLKIIFELINDKE